MFIYTHIHTYTKVNNRSYGGMFLRQYREYEILEFEDETYHAFRNDIGTIVIKKIGGE